MTTISAAMVKELREKTGSGMMDCKEALQECGGDIEKALDYLRKKGTPVVWILGPAEEDFYVPSGDILVSNRPLSLCAALLARCRAFVGNDSGMAHLAAAVGCPSIVLFGPSDPMVWSPRGKNVSIIYKHKSCSPCHRSATIPLSCDNGCMAEITVEEVVNEIGRIISPAKTGRAGRRFTH